jgi:HlyD family secretion protein
MKWLRSKTLWAVVVLAACAAGTTSFVLKRRAAKPAVQWETTAVDRGRIVARVTATGTLSALVTVQVGSQVSGSIQKLYADFNSPVKKGQIIAKIDPRLFQASLENARASYAQAKATLMKDEVQARFAERQSKRQGVLVKDKLVAAADFDTAESTAGTSLAQVEADKANVQQARAVLHQAEVNLALTSIVSPTDGVVISRNVDVGQTVAASLSAPIIFVIAEDLRKMQVDTSVAEADVGKLTAGMDATFMVDAFPGERFKGKVRQIRNAAQTVQNVVTYDAVIDVDNLDLKLRPGMTANVNFIFANREDVLRVPNAALRFRPSPELQAALKLEAGKRGRSAEEASVNREAVSAPASRAGDRPNGRPRPGAGGGASGTIDEAPNQKSVWVLRDGAPQQTRIKTSTSDGTKTEVLEGPLAEGDLVITDATLPAGPKPAAGLLPGTPAPPRGGGGPRPF